MDNTERTILFIFLKSFRSACGNGLMVFLCIWYGLDPHPRSSCAYLLKHNSFNSSIPHFGEFSILLFLKEIRCVSNKHMKVLFVNWPFLKSY